jgi:hypothetical protein
LRSFGGGEGFLDTFIIVPHLRTLEVPEGCLGSDPIDYLNSFISRCCCKLHKLHITDYRKLSEGSYQLAFVLKIPDYRRLSEEVYRLGFASEIPQLSFEEFELLSEEENFEF